MSPGNPRRRAWLRHPPATVRRPPCPSGLQRFANAGLAGAALTVVVADAGLAVTACGVCDGAHLTAVEGPGSPPGAAEASRSS